MLDHYAALLPESLATDLRTLSVTELAQRYGFGLLLLVELSGPDSELRKPLERLSQRRARSRVRSKTDTLATIELPMFVTTDSRVEEPDRTELLARLEGRTWFALPLFKRSGRGHANRLNVGRGNDNDVVLRNRSVSSKHAYFETHDDGSLSLTDVGSTNGTRVNGKRLEHDASRWLQPMDHIQFGQVSTFTCVPAVLRSVMRARSPNIGDGD